MTDNTGREAILGRVRAALADAPRENAATEWAAIPRSFRRSSTAGHEDVVDRFEERLRDYDAQVERAAESDVAALIGRILEERGSPLMVAPEGLPATWLPENNSQPKLDQNFTARELDRFDGVLTAATLGIAETGTLVLQHGPGQGRRALTLVPDFHLCMLQSCDIVATVPEAMARLVATANRPTTFISGPSATADIEMTRIKGVHGPRFLHVVLLV